MNPFPHTRYTMPPRGVPPTKPHIRREPYNKDGPVWVVYFVEHEPAEILAAYQWVQNTQRTTRVITRFGDPR